MSFWLTSPSSLPFWDTLEIVSLVIVWIGVWGEYKAERIKSPYNPTNFPALESKKKKIGAIFWGILLSGLAAEAVASIFIMVVSNKEISELNNENLKLQAKLQPRTINVLQMEEFKAFMGSVVKIPIKISVGQEGFDTETYAKQMRDMFTYAGFKTPPDSGPWGVFRDNTRLSARLLGQTNEGAFVKILYYATNAADFQNINVGFWYKLNYIKSPNSNFSRIPIITDSNAEREIFEAIDEAFEKIRIPRVWMPANGWIKSNEFEIFIPIKNE
jgi:hypothetical protein